MPHVDKLKMVGQEVLLANQIAGYKMTKEMVMLSACSLLEPQTEPAEPQRPKGGRGSDKGLGGAENGQEVDANRPRGRTLRDNL